MHSPIQGNIQLVCKSAYFLKYPKRADVLLGKLFRDPGGGRDGVTLMQLQHCPVSDLHEQGLVLPVVVGLLIGKSKGYGIGCIRTCLQRVGNDRVGE